MTQYTSFMVGDYPYSMLTGGYGFILWFRGVKGKAGDYKIMEVSENLLHDEMHAAANEVFRKQRGYHKTLARSLLALQLGVYRSVMNNDNGMLPHCQASPEELQVERELDVDIDLSGIHPGYAIQAVQRNTGWPFFAELSSRIKELLAQAVRRMTPKKIWLYAFRLTRFVVPDGLIPLRLDGDGFR